MSQTVLAIPELVAAVLQFLDRTSLVAAAQVNTMWVQEATNFIWRGVYPQGPYEDMSRVLRSMADSPPERRHWYTKKIRHLYLALNEDQTLPITLFLKQKDFQFPFIRSLVLDVLSENSHENVIAQFLYPNLLGLEVFGGYYTRWFLEQIRANAPSLRVFLLDNRLFADGYEASEDRLNATDFLRFLQAMPSIEVLELVFGWDSLLGVEVMRHIFTRPRLQSLHLGPSIVWDMQLLNKIDLAGEILQDLRSLQVTADEKPLSLILPRLPHLQAVDLSLLCSTSQATVLNKLLGSLSRCAELREISIGCDGGIVLDNDALSGSALLSVATNCHFIRILEVASSLPAGLTDELVEAMASRLVHLEVLSFDSAPFHGLSYRSIASFARHCPSLCELCLPIRIELTLLEGEPDDVKFAGLQELEVTQATFLPVETANDCRSVQATLTQLLDRRFPHLTKLREIPGSSKHARHMRTSIDIYLRKRPYGPNPRRKVPTKVTLGLLES